MQDRFKFRVFDKENGEMFYPTKEDEHIEIDANGDLIGIDLEGLWCGGLNCILMQCTGLKDKNGKLIYEGDVVKLTGYGVDNVYVIKFGDFAMYDFDFQEDYEKGSTAVYGWYLGGQEYPVPLSISLETSGLEQEVIGNIYENPELLKDGE